MERREGEMRERKGGEEAEGKRRGWRTVVGPHQNFQQIDAYGQAGSRLQDMLQLHHAAPCRPGGPA